MGRTEGGGEGRHWESCLGQGHGGHWGSPAQPWWRLRAGDPGDQVAKRVWKGPAPVAGVGLDGKILFSNLIIKELHSTSTLCCLEYYHRECSIPSQQILESKDLSSSNRSCYELKSRRVFRISYLPLRNY